MTAHESTAARSEISAPALGMILFISSEVMFFAALFGAYFTVRGRAVEWPPPGAELEIILPALTTGVLIASSATIHLAERAAEAADRAGTARWLAATIVLGLVFLVGQVVEYSQLDFALADHSFGTLFYSMTGFHGLHVAGGLGAISLVVIKNGRGHIARQGPGAVKAVSYYWHFVDVVWILLFATLYLLR